jgi:hypothetical protein
MKKIFRLTLVLFCLAILGACSSDDTKTPSVNTQQLVKRWFYSKTKVGSQGSQPYVNTACGKDYLEFQTGNALKENIYSANCQEDPTVTTGMYTLVEDTKTLTTVLDGETVTYTILKLNSKEFQAQTTVNNVKITYIFTSTP